MDIQNDVTSRAMLVSLRISTWSARKYDKKISDEVARNHASTTDAGRYNKHLLPGEAISYRELQQSVSDARAYHYSQTLPWSDEGWRILTTANFMDYSTGMRGKLDECRLRLDNFVGAYPLLKAGAKALLNGMFNEADYPAESDIRSLFRFGVDYNPLPTAGDFRVSLPADEMQLIAERTEQRVKDAVADAAKDAWRRLYEQVEHMRERLADPKAIFRDTLVQNARELTDVLRKLNITADPKLDAACADVVRSLTTREAETLRKNPRLRQAVSGEADRILAAMSGIYTPEVEGK